MRYEMQEIFVKHVNGLRRYPFALVRMLDDNGNEIGTGMTGNSESLYSNPLSEEIDTPVLMEPIIDPPWLHGGCAGLY